MDPGTQTDGTRTENQAQQDRRRAKLNIAGFGALCGLLFVLKLIGASAAGFDFGKEIYHAQELRWIYDAANPPLHTWLLNIFHRTFGLGLWSVLAFNLLLLFAIFVAGFALARRVLPSTGLAAVAAWSFILIGQYHRIQYSMTHSLLVAIACPLALWLLLRVIRHRRLQDYAILGVVVAVGMLSKFLFLAAFLAMVVAAMVRQPSRRAVLNSRFLATISVAAALVGPFLIVAVDHWPRLFAVFRARVGQDVPGTYASGVLRGLGSLGEGVAEYAFLLAIVAALALVPVLMWDRTAIHAKDRTVHPMPILLRDVVAAGLGFLVIAVLVLDVSVIKGRFLHIFLYPLPVLAVSLVARWAPGRAAMRRYVVALAAVGIGTVAMRAVNLSPACLGRCHELVPYDRLAAGLSDAGFRRGTVLALGVRLAGNLRLRFPGSRFDVAVDPFKPALLQAGRQGQCLIIWSEQGIRDGGRLEPLFATAGIHRLEEQARLRTLTRTLRLEWRWHGFAVFDPQNGWRRRRSTWHYILLSKGTPTCR